MGHRAQRTSSTAIYGKLRSTTGQVVVDGGRLACQRKRKSCMVTEKKRYAANGESEWAGS